MNTTGGDGKAWSNWWKEKRRNNNDFLIAAENGELEKVKKLLSKVDSNDPVADINVTGLDNWTALHFAANEGRKEVVEYLLTFPDIEKDALSSIQRTPLHMASIRGHLEITRALVAAGANVNLKDSDENSALHYSSEFGHAMLIIYYIKETDIDPCLRNKYG